MSIGEEFEPLEFVVTPELNQQYLYAEEDFHPRYIEESDKGPPLIHPGILYNMSNNTRSPSFYLPPGWGEVHAAEETEFINPARVGKKVRVKGKIVDRYVKKEREYTVVESLSVDEDGVEIIRVRQFLCYPLSTKKVRAW